MMKGHKLRPFLEHLPLPPSLLHHKTQEHLKMSGYYFPYDTVALSMLSPFCTMLLASFKTFCLMHEKKQDRSKLTAMHCLIMHDCFMRPGPPNFFMSLQKWHSPHSVRRHASHFRHRVRLLRAPDVPRLDDSFTAEAGDAATFGLGRLRGLG